MEKIKVLVVDDHELVRDGIELNLMNNQSIEVVGLAGDSLEFFRQLEDQKPDVVLMDIDLPGKSGIQLTADIKSKSKFPRVVILTSNDQVTYLEKALKAGADGFLSKSSKKDVLVKAIERVYSGETFVDPLLSSDALESLRHKLTLMKDEQELTEREIEVVKCFANGMSYKETANALSVSPKTVEKHKASIFSKLDFSNQADLVKYAIKNKLTDL